MSRLAGRFEAVGTAALAKEELARLIVDHRTTRCRREAIACYLSAGEGWRDAFGQLGGAFAGQFATGLTGRQQE